MALSYVWVTCWQGYVLSLESGGVDDGEDVGSSEPNEVVAFVGVARVPYGFVVLD